MLPPRREGVMHQLGERLTGGYTQTGYLAVRLSRENRFSSSESNPMFRETNPG